MLFGGAMPETRRRYDQEFKDSAVDLVLETGKPIAQIARQLGIHEGTLGNWVDKRRKQNRPEGLSEFERDELRRLRDEVHELRMQRDVLSDPWSSGSTKRWAAGRERLHR
jgi:transposase